MSFKARIIKSVPGLSAFLRRDRAPGAMALVDGAVAGDVAVAGIKKNDQLVSVLNMTDLLDVTGQFIIKGDGVINNNGGTTTASKRLLVTYIAWDER